MDLAAHARDLREQLVDETGLNVAIDPRDAVVPGVILTPNEIRFDRLTDATGSATWSLILVAGSGVEDALADLGDMLTRLRAAVHVSDVRAATLSDPNITGGGILPALTATLTTEWSDQ